MLLSPKIDSVYKLNSSLESQPNFVYDSTGKITGYKTKVGADTVFPFKSGGTVMLTIPSQARYADQAATFIGGTLTLSIDSDGVSIESNNISITTRYVQRPNMDQVWAPTITAELL